MAEIINLPVASLLFDEENPRLASPNQGQRDTLRTLATIQGPKLRVLAQDILTYGLDPSELTIVMPLETAADRYVVLDGNRRLAALRVLENPESVAEAVPATILRALRQLSRTYQDAPLESIPCLVMNDADEARHWIELRHMGERGGAGPVMWGSDESARFRARTDPPEIHTQALDFLQGRGDITQDVRSRIAATTYRRLLGSPDVRVKLGIEWSGQKLKALASEDAVAKALLHVAADIATGRINVGHVYTSEQRAAYANALPADVVATRTRREGEGVVLGVQSTQAAGQQGARRRAGTTRPRAKLIPSDCVLNVTDPRLHDIEGELRRLSLDDYPNAISVLFRVFLELSADAHIEAVPLTVPANPSLGAKLQEVTRDLQSRQKLTAPQARVVRRAAQRDSFLAPSITGMHQYLHNQYMFPAPSDLRADWSNLQPWFVAVWAP